MMKCIAHLANFEFFLSGAQRGIPDTAYRAPLEENPNFTQMWNTWMSKA